MSTSNKSSKHDPRIRHFYKPQNSERLKMIEILNQPEVYDFSKFKKTRTIQSLDLNYYVPEKWQYEDLI